MGQSPSLLKIIQIILMITILVQGNAGFKRWKSSTWGLWTKRGLQKHIDKDGIVLTVRAPVGMWGQNRLYGCNWSGC